MDTHPESDGRYKQSGGIAKAGSEQNGAGVADSEAAMQVISIPGSQPQQCFHFVKLDQIMLCHRQAGVEGGCQHLSFSGHRESIA